MVTFVPGSVANWRLSSDSSASRGRSVCRKPTFQKLLSVAGFQLKGSGWYATDFKNKSSKPAEKKSEEKKSDDKPESKSDAKPEKKTESKSEASA